MKETVTNALSKKAEQIKTAAKILVESINDWQVIKSYLTNKISEESLTEEQKKKLERYQFIYNQLVSGKYTDAGIREMTAKTYKIKSTQAYEDMRNTKELFNTVVNVFKKFEINLQLQINRDMQRKAMELNDMRAAAQLEKNRALLLRLLPDEEETPAEMFEGHELEAVFDPELLGAPKIDLKELLELINQKRKVKINVEKLLVTDLQYEDVKNNEKENSLQ